MNKKRSRSVNWNEEEKQLFCSVLKEHVHVIENKAIDTKTIYVKNKAWEEVYKKFNELNGRHRQLMQLKIQWKKMKLNARKRRKTYTTFQKESTKPGGAARPATPTDAVIEIKYVLNPAELLREHNFYNSDDIDFKPMMFVDACMNDNTSQDIQQISDHDDCVNSMVSHIKMLKEEEHTRRLQMAEEEHSIKMAIQMEKLKSATLEREILELKKAREEKISDLNPLQ